MKSKNREAAAQEEEAGAIVVPPAVALVPSEVRCVRAGLLRFKTVPVNEGRLLCPGHFYRSESFQSDLQVVCTRTYSRTVCPVLVDRSRLLPDHKKHKRSLERWRVLPYAVTSCPTVSGFGGRATHFKRSLCLGSSTSALADWR
jgi:hypothetical protein